MNKQMNTTKITTSALLMAIAILLPAIMPIKVVIGPASFTLASHVPIFLAMFLSPGVGIIVSLGATVGFFVAGFPIVIVFRALTHVLFAYIGGKIIEKRSTQMIESFRSGLLFSFIIGLIHAIAETIIVSLFFFGLIGVTDTSNGFLYTVILLVGVGTLIHSMVDFLIAQYLWKALGNRFTKLRTKMNQELS